MIICISKSDKRPVSVCESGSDCPVPGINSNAIVHELLHLKYLNHGKMFRALLTAHLGKGLHKGEDRRAS